MGDDPLVTEVWVRGKRPSPPTLVRAGIVLCGVQIDQGVSGCLKFSAGFGRHVVFFRAKILIFQPHFLSSCDT